MAPAWCERDESFPTTPWSLVALAGAGDVRGARDALGWLLARYMPALQAHLRYKRLTPEEAEDLVQDFVTNKIIERDLLARAEQDLGKFRTFLLTALDRFLIDRIRAAGAKKRAPRDGALVSMAERADLLQAGPQPSDAFDVAWARGVLDEALARMQAECEASGRADLWGVFESRVLAPALDGTPPMDYQQIVTRFGYRSPTQASNAMITAKRMYARALRSVVGEYARDGQEIEAEVHQLREILAQSGR